MSLFIAFTNIADVVLIACAIYMAYKKYIGYYRFDIPVNLAFTKDDYDIFDTHKRFIIVGCSSSGKSTLAHQLCEKYSHLERIELDYLWWLPNWKERNKEEFKSLLETKISDANENGWVIDGNYKHARDIMWSKVEVVIWLEYGFWEVFYRACKRTLLRIITKEKVCNGNIETLYGFMCDPLQGIPFYVWRVHSKFKGRILKWKSEYPQVKIVKIESPYHCQYWFDNLK
eukprot:365558_1